MREIDCREITAAVEKLCIRANIFLPPEIGIMLEARWESETAEPARSILGDLVENFQTAAEKNIPICQDTGMAVVFMDVGQDVHITGGLLEEAVNEGVRRGYENGYLRKSVVADPIRRGNTGDNTPAVLHTRIVGGDTIKITVAPKGFGSENMSSLRMLLPSASQEEVEDYIVSAVKAAGSNPCPPMIVGVGIGGTFELCAELSKRALARPADEHNPDPYYADMERRLLEKINALGIGPQGFGGKDTALAVNIEVYPTHIAGLPCAVNIGCHVTRHAECVL